MDYWISDTEGRVLGPVGLAVISDLIAARRVDATTRIARDGRTWSPLSSVPELWRIYEQHHPAARATREQAEAQKLRAQLEGLRVRPAHEVFKVDADAPIEMWREAFFKLSKRFHPDALPKDVHPDLRDACDVAFRFLSGLMTRVENGLHRPRPSPPAPPPAPAPRTAEPPPPPPPSYDPEAFVGIKSVGPGLAQARIKVTPRNVGMFTDHPLINIGQGGLFLADERVLPLGTTVAVTLNFEDDPPYTIVARGRVAWEAAGGAGGAHGFGITLQDLRSTDREFIRGFIARKRQ